MKVLLAFLLLCVLTGCGVNTPGQTTRVSPYNWPPLGAPSMELEAVLESVDSPEAIARTLASNFSFTESYDINEFLSPNQFIQTKRGCCTAYARFWITALNRLGYDSRFVAIYGADRSHAVTIFRDENGTYRMASNDRYFADLDLDPHGRGLKAAAERAAREFYGEDWRSIYFFDEQGHIEDGLVHPTYQR